MVSQLTIVTDDYILYSILTVNSSTDVDTGLVIPPTNTAMLQGRLAHLIYFPELTLETANSVNIM